MQATMWARPFFIAAPPNGCYPIIYCTSSMDQGAVGVVVVYVIFDTLLLLHFSDHQWMSSTHGASGAFVVRFLQPLKFIVNKARWKYV